MKQDDNAPSVSLAFPPVGWHKTLVHEGQTTTVCACEKTVVMAKQPEKEKENELNTSIRRVLKVHTWALDVHKI